MRAYFMRDCAWDAASWSRRCARDMKERTKKEITLLSMNPPTTHYEFFGPPGATFVTLTVPTVAYALFFACNEANDCIPQLDTERVLATIQNPQWWASLWDNQAALIYLAWYTFCVLSWAILPGDWVDGTTLRTGDKKKYKINGTFSSCLFSFFFLT